MAAIKTAEKFASIIRRIAECYKFDIQKDSGSLRLENPPYMPLVLKKLDTHIISVAHYFEQNGNLIADPDVELFIPSPVGENNGWIPLAIQQTFGYFRAAELNSAQNQVVLIRPRIVADVVDLCHIWATNLVEQEWLISNQANPEIVVKVRG